MSLEGCNLLKTIASDPSEEHFVRTALDVFYRVCGWLSAGFVVLILTVVLGQVVLNVISATIESTLGYTVGLLIPSYSDFSGYFLASATFFGMAYTFQAGEHIRVTLFTSSLPQRMKLLVEIGCLAAAFLMVVLVAVEALNLTHESWIYGDSSYGLVAVPIWIPQLSFALGSLAFAISIGDALVTSFVSRAEASEVPIRDANGTN